MLLEIIFKGAFSDLNLSFLSKLLIDSKEGRFNYPEIPLVKNPEDIFKTNEYVDFIIATDCFSINEKKVPKVFINIIKDSDDVEMLIFFDLHDLNNVDSKKGIDNLMAWTDSFKNDYNFEYYICQMDNADENEYYFDSSGVGPLYDR